MEGIAGKLLSGAAHVVVHVGCDHNMKGGDMYRFTIEEIESALTSFGKSCGMDDATIADAWHAMVVQLSIIAAKASGEQPTQADNTQSTAIAQIVEAVEGEIKHAESLKKQYPRIDANDFIRCMTIIAQQLRAL